jgi:hypothetical protein
MLTEDMDELLRQYFAWAAMQDPADLTYPHIDPVRRLLGSSLPSLHISDDEAQHIDRALCRLKADNADAHQLIIKVYRQHRTLRWLEARGEGERKTLARRIAEGREYVRGYLSGAMAQN